ncbi:MAG: hypothetical protein WA414_04985 [Acidobacteriaceae bacterium]|jgi:hypothetical protein
MNQYLFLRRMRGPIFLLVFGVTAILDVYTPIDYGRSWPLYLIVWGIMKLAENAILAQNPPPPPGQWPGAPGSYPGGYQAPYQGPYAGSQPGSWPGTPGPGAGAGAGAGAQGGTGTQSGTGSTTAIVPSTGEERR